MPEKGRKQRKKTEDARAKVEGAADAPSRAIWSGTISFGLVSIPVELRSAARGRQVSMKMVDTDGHALGRQYVCSKEGVELGGDAIVRGYETDEGEMVVVTDEELEAIAPDKSREIDLRRFVDLAEIPPTYFDRPYFMVPANDSTKAYHLLARTLEETGRAGIGTFVMRGHEYLVAILAEGGVLRAETLRHAEELRSPERFDLPAPADAPKARVKALGAAIDELTSDALDPHELKDEYAEALHELARAHVERGEGLIGAPDVQSPGEEEDRGVIDLMQVLKERLSSEAKVTTADERPATAAADDLTELSKTELYERAQDLDIAGRSKMAKDDLVRAIREAS